MRPPSAPQNHTAMNPVTMSGRDPAWFSRNVLGWEPWSKQVQIANGVRDAIVGDGPKRVAARSGNGRRPSPSHPASAAADSLSAPPASAALPT